MRKKESSADILENNLVFVSYTMVSKRYIRHLVNL